MLDVISSFMHESKHAYKKCINTASDNNLLTKMII